MVDRTLHLLAVVSDSALGQRVEEVLRIIGAAYLLTQDIAPEHITFAHRLGKAVILAGVSDPLALLAYLRLAGVDLPVVVLGNGGDRNVERQLLAGGAAACGPLPRSQAELLSALTAALDGALHGSEPPSHDVALDPVGLTVRWRGNTAKLTRREFALLHGLVSRAGTPVSIARLQAHAWGEALPQQSASQIVTVYVHQIRRKLRSLGLADGIVTVRNFGYVFVPPGRERIAAKRVRRGASAPSSPASSSSPASPSPSPSPSPGPAPAPASRSSASPASQRRGRR